MNVFVAGATGTIGRLLVAELARRGHVVTGTTRSEVVAASLAALVASVARVSAFDAPALGRALRESKAEAVIDQQTVLPKIRSLRHALGTRREETGGHPHPEVTSPTPPA